MTNEYVYRHRTKWNVSRRETTKPFKNHLCAPINTNEGKQIEIRHVSSTPISKKGEEFFFTYAFFYDDKKIKKECGVKLFVGPHSSIDDWVKEHDQSLYDLDDGEKVPNVFSPLDNCVRVPYSDNGVVLLDKGKLVYLVGREKYELGMRVNGTS